MAIEEPKYTLIEKSDNIELRVYEPKIIAEVTVSGTIDEVGSKGFRLIADYIFGNNTTATGSNREISMTAPVTIKPTSEKSAMTAPVTLQAEPTADNSQTSMTETTWKMYFVMPSEYSLETLPTPNNSAVTLKQISASNYAVIRFSGFTGEKKVAKKTAELTAWLKKKSITPTGTPELARYNPPWTLPFWRRNEIMIEY
jgi:hypothetical protein